MSSFSQASPESPAEAAPGAAQAAPTGVWPNARAVSASAATESSSCQFVVARPRMLGAVASSAASAMIRVTSRARLVRSHNAATVRDSLAPSTEDATIRIAANSANTGASPCRTQSGTCAATIIISRMAGTLNRLDAARPTTTRFAGIPSTAKTRGSAGSSPPKSSGTSRKPSVTIDPAITRTLPASEDSVERSPSSAPTA